MFFSSSTWHLTSYFRLGSTFAYLSRVSLCSSLNSWRQLWSAVLSLAVWVDDVANRTSNVWFSGLSFSKHCQDEALAGKGQPQQVVKEFSSNVAQKWKQVAWNVCTPRFLDMATLKTLERYSHFHPSPLTIKQFMEFGKSLETTKEKSSANFLRKELPLRLAIITKEMDLLPKKLLDTPSIFALQVHLR